jgi:putative membrane protein
MPAFRPVDFAHAARGFLMGAADIVPGVSGGTVALILGIYQRLVGALSRVDRTLMQLLAQRQWTAAARYLDLRFLVALATGIVTGIVSLASLMHYLLQYQRNPTLAVFFGLILASSFLVGRMVGLRRKHENVLPVVLGLAAALFAYWLVGLPQLQGSETIPYFFLCGVLGICAMILPGISGAYILWMLGAYVSVTGMLKSLLHLEVSPHQLGLLASFVAGCAVGLLGFSKLLQWLLRAAHRPTMAVLCGFMLGSLRKMWPFQRDVTPWETELKLKTYENYRPEVWGADEWLCVALAVAAFVGVVALEAWAARSQRPPGGRGAVRR